MYKYICNYCWGHIPWNATVFEIRRQTKSFIADTSGNFGTLCGCGAFKNMAICKLHPDVLCNALDPGGGYIYCSKCINKNDRN